MTRSRAAIFPGMVSLFLSSVSPLAAEAAQGTQPPAKIGGAMAAYLSLRAPTCDFLASPPGDADTQMPGVKFQDINTAAALDLCEQAAKQPKRSPRDLYLYGRVLDAAKRYAEAAKQYAAADKAGYPRAAAAMGGLYYMGLGVPKDAGKAIGLYRRAGDLGYAEAYAVLATIYLEQQPPNYSQAIAAYDRAARAGSPLGQVGLGEMYGGGLGVTKDPARAATLFRQAADKDEPLGMFDLGVSYLVGAGVQRNPQTAFQWLLRAAERDIPQAQNAVAHMYERGEGVAEDRGQAIAWYRKIAEQGDPVAKADLRRLEDQTRNASAAPSTDTTSGGFGDQLGGGGFIKPLPGSTPPSAGGAQPREPSTQPSNDIPYRPLPTQRADPGVSDGTAILLGLGIAASVWWLLSGSNESSSSGSGIDYSSSSPDFSGFGGGGGGSSTPSDRPVSSPMNGDITRTLHGEDALYGQVNRR